VRFESTLRHKALINGFAALGLDQGHRYGVTLPLFLDAFQNHDVGGKLMRHDYDKVLSFAEISTADDVRQRLGMLFKPTRASNLYRFWEVLCAEGDAGAREHYSRATYYRHRAELKAARIGTLGNDVELEQKRRDRQRAEQLELFQHLEGYGEHLRSMIGDERVDELQRELGLPAIGDRETA
jgi:hypothetical protein